METLEKPDKIDKMMSALNQMVCMAEKTAGMPRVASVRIEAGPESVSVFIETAEVPA